MYIKSDGNFDDNGNIIMFHQKKYFKKMKFPLRISPVNVTKSICWKI